ncbi:MAG: isopentenyl-diphosphate Delta-isomerase [Ferruginibacter sp.]
MDIILVDEADNEVGTMEKIEVHQKALLHRAFSIFIFNEAGEMLLQKRAAQKYHSAGLWTNACCSHPAPGTDTLQAAGKRLEEEMGFNVLLEKAFHFIYKAPFDNGLTEHEFDHVFIGKYDGEIQPNPVEVSDFCFRSLEDIELEIQKNPGEFTVWFKIAFPKVVAHFARISLTT